MDHTLEATVIKEARMPVKRTAKQERPLPEMQELTGMGSLQCSWSKWVLLEGSLMMGALSCCLSLPWEDWMEESLL